MLNKTKLNMLKKKFIKKNETKHLRTIAAGKTANIHDNHELNFSFKVIVKALIGNSELTVTRCWIVVNDS